ncbi:UNKNOWN [Stylonychia lemnae]|uniref:Uncharacterized protein n=1 Tax=Stylonychia lemnae TaxID=5949 RepID=A0A078B4I4_STYLE|nr:UNKNOWN [Stylonychia lemnae]|eukprot:CDW89435.1 UNKNOWN [Stylonychia lemnae]
MCLSIGISDYSKLEGQNNLISASFDSRKVANKFKEQGFMTTHLLDLSSQDLEKHLMEFQQLCYSASRQKPKAFYAIIYIQGLTQLAENAKKESNHYDYSENSLDILLSDNTWINLVDTFQEMFKDTPNINYLYFQDGVSVDDHTYGRIRQNYNSISKVTSNVVYAIFSGKFSIGNFLANQNHAWATDYFLLKHEQMPVLQKHQDPKNFDAFVVMKEIQDLLLKHLTVGQNLYGFEIQFNLIKKFFTAVQKQQEEKQLVKRITLMDYIDINAISNQYCQLQDLMQICNYTDLRMIDLPNNNTKFQHLVLIYGTQLILLFDLVTRKQFDKYEIQEKYFDHTDQKKFKFIKVIPANQNDLFALTNKNEVFHFINYKHAKFTKLNRIQLFIQSKDQKLKATEICATTHKEFVVGLSNGTIQFYSEKSRQYQVGAHYTCRQFYSIFTNECKISTIISNYTLKPQSKTQSEDEEQLELTIGGVGMYQEGFYLPPQITEHHMKKEQSLVKLTCNRPLQIKNNNNQYKIKMNTSYIGDRKDVLEGYVLPDGSIMLQRYFKGQNSQCMLANNSVSYQDPNTLATKLSVGLCPFKWSLQPQIPPSIIYTSPNQIKMRFGSKQKIFTIFQMYYEQQFNFSSGIIWTSNDQIYALSENSESSMIATFSIDKKAFEDLL